MARIESEVRTASRQGGLLEWVDARFPLTKMLREHVTDYYAAKNFNVWYVFGVLAMLVLVIQVLTGIFLTMNYKPSAADAFALGGVHHARRRVGVADSLHALHRCVGVLRRGLPAHVPSHVVRLVQKAARTDLDRRHADFPGPDGRSVHGLPVAMGTDVLLGRPGHRVLVRRHTGHRRDAGRVDSRRLFDFRYHPEPLFSRYT